MVLPHSCPYKRALITPAQLSPSGARRVQASQDMFMQSLAGEPPEWQRGDDVMVMPECEGNIQDPFDNPYSRRLSASFHHRRT